MGIETNKKLAYLSETKGLIKAALIEKGQPVSDDDTFRSYAGKILDIAVGGGNLVAASGYFEPTTTSQVVAHGMGVKPDLVVVYAEKTPTVNLSVFMAVGVSSVMRDKGIRISALSKAAIYSATGDYVMTLGLTEPMDSGASSLVSNGAVRDVSETTFKVGGGTSFGVLDTGLAYHWFAFGGIT